MEESKEFYINRLLLITLTVYFLAWVFMYGWILDFEDKSDLREVSGVITKLDKTKHKGWITLHFYISGKSGRHHLVQDNITGWLPKINELRRGDYIRALVADLCCLEEVKVWEIWRGEEAIFTYEDMVWVIKKRNISEYELGFYVFIFASILLAIWYYLRFVYLPKTKNNAED